VPEQQHFDAAFEHVFVAMMIMMMGISSVVMFVTTPIRSAV
jgi:hypothetical protein